MNEITRDNSKPDSVETRKKMNKWALCGAPIMGATFVGASAMGEILNGQAYNAADYIVSGVKGLAYGGILGGILGTFIGRYEDYKMGRGKYWRFNSDD